MKAFKDRSWWVHAEKISDGSKSVEGPFMSVLNAAIFINSDRPYDYFRRVAVTSRVEARRAA